MAKSLWVERECPYGSDLRWTLWESPYQNDRIQWDLNELKWIEWNEWIEGFDFVNPMAKSLWCEKVNPMEVTWLISMRMSLSKWWELMRFEWIEVNRMNRGEISELKDLTLWTLWESPYGVRRCPYQSDLSEGENECHYQNDQNRWDLNELKWIERLEVKWVNWRIWLWTLWKSPYELSKVNPIKMTWVNLMGFSLWVK